MADRLRFQVRGATGPNWDWLPDWVVVDTEKEVRVAAYGDEGAARKDCAERNAAIHTALQQGAEK